MKSIGDKIKELRRARDMTQEELANDLGVTYQTVSKWETGATSPDLSLIVPIARMFGVTTDELFDYSESADELRRGELEKQYYETFKSGDLKARLAISEQAMKEFPSDMKWLDRYGWAVWCGAIAYVSESADFEAEREKAIGIFKTVIDRMTDDAVKCDSIIGITQCLCDAGRKTEALTYVEKFPKVDPIMLQREEIRLDCLEGEEQQRGRQKHLMELFDGLFGYLCWHFDDKTSTETAIALAKLFFPGGNYLYYAHDLAYLYKRKAKRLANEGNGAEADGCLREAFRYAENFDAIKGKYTYTAPLFCLVSCDEGEWCKTGEGTTVDDLRSALIGEPEGAAVRRLDAYREIVGE